VALPKVDVIDEQGEVCSAVFRVHDLVAISYQVQFLTFTQPKPGTVEAKWGTRNRLELEYVRIKIATLFNVTDVKRYMVQL
jgi:hypothetical protein